MCDVLLIIIKKKKISNYSSIITHTFVNLNTFYLNCDGKHISNIYLHVKLYLSIVHYAGTVTNTCKSMITRTTAFTINTSAAKSGVKRYSFSLGLDKETNGVDRLA